MKKQFAIVVQVDGSFVGQISLDHYTHLLEMKDGEIYNNGGWMKVGVVEVDLPFDTVDGFIEQAKATQKHLQLETIKRKEKELEKLKAQWQENG